MKTKLHCLLLIFVCLLLSGFTLGTPDTHTLFKEIKQDFLVYVPEKALDKPLLAKDVQGKLYQDYVSHYFSPWNNPDLLYSEQKVKEIEEGRISKFLLAPGWGINQQLHNSQWVNGIVQNMTMKSYPNISQTAITICVTHLKSLPTVEPSFKDWADPANGYPFNQLEVSLLPANLPIKIVQISQDGAWGLALTPYNAIGWLPFNDFAFVDKNFMQRWQTGHYVAIIKDQLSVLDGERNFLFLGRIGAIYSLITAHADKYQIVVAKMGEHHQAVSQVIALAKSDAVELPMPLTPRNLGKIANVMLEQPYDWGGHYGYRDCSATMMDLFAAFGLWLPRSSVDQIHAGKFISLENLDDKAKQALIQRHAVPFLTLLWLPGHIALYLGEYEGRGFVYQTAWSVPVEHWFKGSSRLLIGKTVITPFDFGKDFPFNATAFLKRVKGMAVVGELKTV